MTHINIDFAKHSYQARSKPLNAQQLINVYLEPAPKDSKAPHALYGTPGLDLNINIGNGPIFGLHIFNGLLYIVSGSEVFTLGSSGSTTNLGNIGSVSDVVIMANNINEVMIVKNDGTGYVATPSSLTQITDPDYLPASSVTYLDGFLLTTVLDSNKIQISALNNALSWGALDVAFAEESPDKTVRAFALKGNVWIFGEESIEIFYNSGGADFPFVPLQGAAQIRGCAAKRTVVQEDNTLFWFGDDRIIYRADGYIPKRISTYAIEKQLQSYTTVTDAEAFSYTQEGHKFYCITFPTELQSWVYDVSTGLWHERQSFEKGRWRATSHAFIFGKNLVGDFEKGNIYELNLDTYTENGDILQLVAVSPPIFNQINPITHNRIWIDFDAGFGTISGQGENPQVSLEYSNDGANTWSSERFRSMGKQGEYKHQSTWTSLGRTPQRTYRITITDPVKRHITGMYGDIRIGRA